MINPSSKITIPDSVLHQELDAESVLLELTTETYYGLDDVGTRVWQLLNEHGNVDAIVTALLAEYEVGEATLRGDVERLLGELAGAGLIQLRPSERGERPAPDS